MQKVCHQIGSHCKISDNILRTRRCLTTTPTTRRKSQFLPVYLPLCVWRCSTQPGRQTRSYGGLHSTVHTSTEPATSLLPSQPGPGLNMLQIRPESRDSNRVQGSMLTSPLPPAFPNLRPRLGDHLRPTPKSIDFNSCVNTKRTEQKNINFC